MSTPIVNLSEEREARVEAAWQEYLKERLLAEVTGDIRHGIAAGQAWGRFIRLWESAARSEPFNGVTPLKGDQE